VSLTALADVIQATRYDLLSTDLFDTVILRDHTIESDRLAIACRRSAAQLGVDPSAVTRLRWSLQRTAYRAVTIERPGAEASLSAICRTAAIALGLGEEAARLLHQIEVDVDIEHLRPHRGLIEFLDRVARSGMRVIAVSDTYLGQADLHRILDSVVGPHPIAAVYSSADLGLTKHRGGVFAAVAERENVPAERIMHIGDNYEVDVRMAQVAGWHAIHLPRHRLGRVKKTLGKVLAVPTKIRTAQ
jgi:HAD superfamily hydrolase (TIGR01549 family)